MANIPIEIINLTSDFSHAIANAITLSNKCQSLIKFELVDSKNLPNLEFLNLSELNTEFAFDQIDKIRNQIKGFHPFILLITDSYLYNDYYNIFGSHRAEKGLGIFTTHSVPEIIIPKNKIEAYFIYYFARYSLSYFNPEQKNHVETRGCLYDKKISKIDIVKSMRKGAFCDDCKKNMLLSEKSLVNEDILNAVDSILNISENIWKNVLETNILIPEEDRNITIKKIKEYIADARIVKAFELLAKYSLPELNNDIFLVRNRYNSLLNDYRNGTISYEVYTLEMNRLILSFISVLDKIKDD